VLLVRALYKLSTIVNTSKQTLNKREFRAYDISIKYTNKEFGKKFID